MAGLLTRPSVRFTVATSPASVSSPYWAAITSYPSDWSVGITLVKHEPSAQIPWQKTMLGLACADAFTVEPPVDGKARPAATLALATSNWRRDVPLAIGEFVAACLEFLFASWRGSFGFAELAGMQSISARVGAFLRRDLGTCCQWVLRAWQLPHEHVKFHPSRLLSGAAGKSAAAV